MSSNRIAVTTEGTRIRDHTFQQIHLFHTMCIFSCPIGPASDRHEIWWAWLVAKARKASLLYSKDALTMLLLTQLPGELSQLSHRTLCKNLITSIQSFCTSGERTVVTERLLDDSTWTPAKSRLANSSSNIGTQETTSPIQPVQQITNPQPIAESQTPEVIPVGARLRGRKSMDLLPGKAGTEMLADITFDALDVPYLPSPSDRQRQDNTGPEIATPSVFPGVLL